MRFRAVVLGVNHKSEFHLNGEYLGNHVAAIASFVLPVAGGNAACRRHDIVWRPTTSWTCAAASRRGRWRGGEEHGGVLRDIYLLACEVFAARCCGILRAPAGRRARRAHRARVGAGRPGQDSVSGPGRRSGV